jgi:hypothetical protein
VLEELHGEGIRDTWINAQGLGHLKDVGFYSEREKRPGE